MGQSLRFLVVFAWVVCVLGRTLQLPSDPGSCSQTCENRTSEETLFPCSCSSSCSLYRDCCFDSPHRKTEQSAVSEMCITLATRGVFRAVSDCPSSWPGSSQFCRGSIGYLPPVTSTASGTTYANLHCAVCNEDGEELTTWRVQLRCCPEHDDLDGRRFVYERDHLWSKVEHHGKCTCHYVSDDPGFADRLELRSCHRRQEIARCSSSWQDETVRGECRSYLSPVYIGEKLYRNVECGRCNFERLDRVRCMPADVERMLSEGSNLTSILEHCRRRTLTTCLNYFDHLQRGPSFTFSSFLNIRQEGCVPPPGERCCAGSRYNYREKKCRATKRPTRL